MKAVIATGGKGGRMNISDKPICKGLISIGGKPLIINQLKQFESIGIEEVIFAVTRDSVFNDYEKRIDFPNLNYRVFINDHCGHPIGALRNNSVLELVNGHSFIFTYDDLFYNPAYFTKIAKSFDFNNNSFGTIH